MVTVDYIFNNFKISDEEYAELDCKFGQLCYFVAQDLKRKNSKNNFTDEIEDIAQDLRWSLSRAGVYTKRQKYIEDSLSVIKQYVKNSFVKMVIEELEGLWDERTKHGANRQKFGFWQEQILDTLLTKYVPEDKRPNKESKLNIDEKFSRYCKAIIWNQSKNLGKKITKERNIRNQCVSLSEFDFLADTL